MASAKKQTLLRLRLCDLELSIRGSILEARIKQVFGELKARGLRFRPYFWASDEWFTPAGVTGVAVPFYMLHPRLARLERSMMLEAEGSSHEECIRILRHEVGHAIDHAFRLGTRVRWRRLFGNPSKRYPTTYLPKPKSRNFVQHLASWYAQAHPDEDFAETFAVWLSPRSNWRKRYQHWPALRKLEYVDELMTEIKGQKPKRVTRRLVDPIEDNTMTLAEYYRRKQDWYGLDIPDIYDRDLRRLFSDAPEHARRTSAARFVRSIAPEVRRRIASWTGESQYTLDQVLSEIVKRCSSLRLRLASDEESVKTNLVILLTMQTMNFLHSAPKRLIL